MERFNKTLKEMLRKTAVEEGKDWDKLIPYVLFAYREVPQESTGFSPFELLYGREVRGPLDVLKETWEAGGKEGDVSVLSYVLSMRKKFEKMATLVKENLSKAQNAQKMTGVPGNVGFKQETTLWFCYQLQHQNSLLSGRGHIRC